MTPRNRMKMHVPAYAPVVEGVHCDEYNGVEWSVVKTIDMLIMP